jgi:hypothetical protein
MRSFVICARYYQNNVMGRACVMHTREVHTKFWLKNLKDRETYEDIETLEK